MTYEQMMEQEARMQAELDAMVVTDQGYTRGDLSRVFDRIKDPADWKAPILATCPGEAVTVVVEAIKFFTATVPTVSLDTRTMTYVIESEGYRMGPAGDH